MSPSIFTAFALRNTESMARSNLSPTPMQARLVAPIAENDSFASSLVVRKS